MTSNAETGQPSGKRAVGFLSRRSSLWLRLLVLSMLSATAATAVTCIIAAIMNGGQGALSTAFGAALVMLFFGISLLIGHFVGRNNPSGAVGLFVATYFVKVIGFAVVLFAIGAPEWLHGRWFLIGAVVTVVFWQAAEIYGFSKARLQIYNDPAEQEGRPDVSA
jgi:ATP synthase protein I